MPSSTFTSSKQYACKLVFFLRFGLSCPFPLLWWVHHSQEYVGESYSLPATVTFPVNFMLDLTYHKKLNCKMSSTIGICPLISVTSINGSPIQLDPHARSRNQLDVFLSLFPLLPHPIIFPFPQYQVTFIMCPNYYTVFWLCHASTLASKPLSPL